MIHRDKGIPDLVPGAGNPFGAPSVPNNSKPSDSNEKSSSSSSMSSSGGSGLPSNLKAIEDYIKKTVLSVDPNAPLEWFKSVHANVAKVAEEASRNTPETRARDVANLRAKERRLHSDKLVATLLTVAGVQGGAQLLAAANDAIHTTAYMASQIQHNPEQFYANKKAEVYQAAGQYLQGVAMGLGSRPDIAGMLTGLGQMYNGYGQQMTASASYYGANVQGNIASLEAKRRRADLIQGIYGSGISGGLTSEEAMTQAKNADNRIYGEK